MPQALVALGSNLGDRAEFIAQAFCLLRELPHSSVLRQSAVRETQAIGGPPDQGAFLNAAVLLETELAPHALLQALQGLERRAGREPAARWGPRPLDLDVLLYDDVVLNEPALTLPHPRLAVRRFVLQPAAEIAPQWLHPLFRSTLAQLWDHLQQAPPLVLLASAPRAAAAELLVVCPAQAEIAWIASPPFEGLHQSLDEAAFSAYSARVLHTLAENTWVVTDCRLLATELATQPPTESIPPGQSTTATTVARLPAPKAVVLWQEEGSVTPVNDDPFLQCVRNTAGTPYLDLGICRREEVIRQLLALVAGMQ